MATEWTEFWKIEGNIIKKTHHESITEKEDKPNLGVIRRLSRRSVRNFDKDDEFLDTMSMQIQRAVEANESRRNSYIAHDRIIEEVEEDAYSSSLKSKPPTSETSSDENSSYNIFGDDKSSSSEEKSPKVSRKAAPNIEVQPFSTKFVYKLKSNVSSMKKKSSVKSKSESKISSSQSQTSSHKSDVNDQV